jgi:hypothetical protein
LGELSADELLAEELLADKLPLCHMLISKALSKHLRNLLKTIGSNFPSPNNVEVITYTLGTRRLEL